MKITLKEIPIREVVSGYKDDREEGVSGFSGKLNIRPKYQREFVYDSKQREAVIETVRNQFPLNTMYWIKSDTNEYELLDGQQRTISICQYFNNDFSIKENTFVKMFHSLTEEEQEAFLDYKLMIYICEGNEKEKLEWFKVINIAGEKLTPQELRNAIYTGKWLTNAKAFFSRTGAPAYELGNKYLSGKPIRQDYLETAIRWGADKDDVDSIEEYMAIHQHDTNARELRLYFQSVINWLEELFPEEYYRREMKGIDWGILYNRFKDEPRDAKKMDVRVTELMLDDEVTNKKGIYTYLFDGKEKHLSLRTFSAKQKRQLYDTQSGICNECEKEFAMTDMEADHIIPWSKGGKTSLDNGQMLCRTCNREKGSK